MGGGLKFRLLPTAFLSGVYVSCLLFLFFEQAGLLGNLLINTRQEPKLVKMCGGWGFSLRRFPLDLGIKMFSSSAQLSVNGGPLMKKPFFVA